MEKNIKKFMITKDISIKEAMRKMGAAGEKILFVVDENKCLVGSVSDGDIRRWVLSEGGLTESVDKLYNKKPITVNEDYDVQAVKEMMLEDKIEWIPVIDKKRDIQDVLLWDNIFGEEGQYKRGKIDMPVMIMAGGRGTRLDPFTKILPKPLIPVGDKTIIELILDKYNAYGITEFYVSIHHKSQMIKAYFQEINLDYKIHYIEEKNPLGTAGSLKLIEDKVKDSVIVSNCDIIIESNYYEMVKFHQEKEYDITLVGSFRHFKIPYGICHIENGGSLASITEKPEYDYLVNTGMYMIKKEVLKYIESNSVFHMTDLVAKVKERGGRIGVFPIDEKSWTDIGQWEEYHQAVQKLGVMR